MVVVVPGLKSLVTVILIAALVMDFSAGIFMVLVGTASSLASCLEPCDRTSDCPCFAHYCKQGYCTPEF